MGKGGRSIGSEGEVEVGFLYVLGWGVDHDADFFFQAEGGIRVLTVTVVQACALPVSACSFLLAGCGGVSACSFLLAGCGGVRKSVV